MKVPFVAIFLLFLHSVLGFTAAQTYYGGYDNTPSPCPTQLIVATNTVLFPFNTTSVSCAWVWGSRDYILMYQQTAPSVWSFVLSAPDTNAYIAMGFSSNGKMVGSSAIAGWVTSAGSGVAKQYYLGGKDPTQCTPSQGYLPLAQGPFIVSESQRLYLGFQLNTPQPQPQLIYALGPQGRTPGLDNYLPKHDDRVSTYINYATGYSEAYVGWSTLQKVHGSLSLAGWGVLLTIGVLVARYGKHWEPTWLYAHASIQVIAFGVGIGGVVTGFILAGDVSDNVDVHKGIGIGVLALVTLQVTALLLRPKKESKLRKYWNWYHHNVGRIAVALAIANIFYGLSLAGQDTSWFIGYGCYLGVWVLVCLALEIRSRVKKSTT